MALCFAALLVLVDRATVLERFSFRYTDHDQVVYWTAAAEAAKGEFHEPRFYGQPYHHYVDAIVAAPLVGAGVAAPVALPVAASLISLLPFLILAFCAWRKRLLLGAAAALVLPLVLPLSYSLIVSMPKGFATGILFCSIAACLALSPMTARQFFLVGLLLPLSVSLVLSTATLAAPIGVYCLARNLRRPKLYLWGGLGALLAAALHLAAGAFYRLHPGNVVFPPTGYLAFSWSDLWARLARLDDFWAPVSPHTPLGAWLVPLILCLALAAALARRDAAAGGAILVGGAAFVFSLGVAHVGVGSQSVFYPLARMYLPLPVFLLLAVLWTEVGAGDRLVWRAKAPVAVVACLLLIVPFALRRDRLEEEIRVQMAVPSMNGVDGHPVDKVEEGCRQIQQVLEEDRADLVVFTSGSVYQVLVYACEVLSHERYETLSLIAIGDRRTWRLAEVAARNPRRVGLFNIDRRRYLAGLELGATFGPPRQLQGTGMLVMELPEGARLLEFLDAMGLENARAAILRLQPETS